MDEQIALNKRGMVQKGGSSNDLLHNCPAREGTGFVCVRALFVGSVFVEATEFAKSKMPNMPPLLCCACCCLPSATQLLSQASVGMLPLCVCVCRHVHQQVRNSVFIVQLCIYLDFYEYEVTQC